LLAGATAALFVARPLVPSEAAAWMGLGQAFLLITLLLALGWALTLWTGHNALARMGWADLWIGLFFLWQAATALIGAFRSAWRPGINLLWEGIGLGLAFLLARHVLRTGRSARAFAAVMIGLAASLSAYSVYQYFVTMPELRAQLAADPDRTLRETGVSDDPRSRQMFINRANSLEPLATFELTNSFAGFLVPWLVVLVGIVVGGRGTRTWSEGTWLGLLVIGLLVGVALALTKSRSGYLAASSGIGLVLIACRPGGWRPGWGAGVAGVGALVIVVISAALIGGLDAELLTEARKSLGFRWEYWTTTVRMVGDFPVFGTGPGNFGDEYTRFKLPEASEEIKDPHNLLLEVWANSGTPALVLFSLAGGWVLYGGLRRTDGNGPSDNGSSPSPVASGSSGEEPGLKKGAVRKATRPSENGGAEVKERVLTRCILVGGGCGWVLAMAAGSAMGVPPPWEMLPISLAVGGTSVWLLRGFIEEGNLGARTCVVGLIALAVNLLAAGGFSFPGVAQSLWALAGLALSASAGSDGVIPVRSRVGAVAALLVLMLALFVASSYLPVTRSAAAISRAEAEPRRLRETLAEAAEADPYSAENWRNLAYLDLREWMAAPSPEKFARFEEHKDRFLACRPNASEAWSLAATWYEAAYLAGKDTSMGDGAVEAYRRALALYPHHPVRWARLALLFERMGRQREAQEAAEEAGRLDRLSPHADFRLDEELRGEVGRIQKNLDRPA
jgi:hypothetical protein